MGHWFVQVGGPLDDAAQQGEDFIKWSDTAVEKTPLVNEALEIQQTIFDVADEVGVGQEVRAMVYTLRGAQYIGSAAANLGASGAAGAGVMASLGAFGAAAVGGAVVVIVIVVFDWLFSDGDDADAARKRKEKAKARLEESLQELLEPMTLTGMADEQDKVANAFTSLTVDPQQWEQVKADRERAKRMAQFYRIAAVKLSARQRRFFEALINLGRWGQAQQLLSGQSAKVQEALSVAVYETGWKPSNSKYPGGKAPTLPGTEGAFGSVQYDMARIVPYRARLAERLGQAQATLAEFADNGSSKGWGWLLAGVLALGGALAWRHPALVSRLGNRAADMAAKVNPW